MGTQHALSKPVHAALLEAYRAALAALPGGGHAERAQHNSESAEDGLATAWRFAHGERSATKLPTSLLRTHLLKTLHLPDAALSGAANSTMLCTCPAKFVINKSNAYHHLSSCQVHEKTPRSDAFLAGVDECVRMLPGNKTYRVEPRPFASSRARPDRLLSGVAGWDACIDYLLDATVGEPCSESYVLSAAKKTGWCAAHGHAVKLRDYRGLLSDTQQLVPLSAETHGAIHPSFAKLLKDCARMCAENAPHSAPSGRDEAERLRRLTAHHLHCFRVLLSVALVKGTAKHVHVAARSVADAANPADATTLGRRLARSEEARSSLLGSRLWRPPQGRR